MKFPERPDLSRLPWQRAARLGPLLAWSLALAVTAWVGADLFWRFNAPHAPALPVAAQAAPQAAAQAIASRHLMGSGTDTPQAAAAAPSRYTLHAVVTGAEGRPGWAVLSIDGGPQQGFVEGQPMQSGTALARVRADAVDIATGGLTQTIALAPRSGGASPSISGQPLAEPAPAPANPPSSPELGGDATDHRPDAAPRNLAPGFPIRIPAQPPTPSP